MSECMYGIAWGQGTILGCAYVFYYLGAVTGCSVLALHSCGHVGRCQYSHKLGGSNCIFILIFVWDVFCGCVLWLMAPFLSEFAVILHVLRCLCAMSGICGCEGGNYCCFYLWYTRNRMHLPSIKIYKFSWILNIFNQQLIIACEFNFR
jgi:hypothetical protein